MHSLLLTVLHPWLTPASLHCTERIAEARGRITDSRHHLEGEERVQILELLGEGSVSAGGDRKMHWIAVAIEGGFAEGHPLTPLGCS